LFKNAESWSFKIGEESHLAEMEYLILTGSLRLRLDGKEIKHWPGGPVAGARTNARHEFEVGGQQVIFDAGLSKFNRYFRLSVDGKEVKGVSAPLTAGSILAIIAITAGFIVLGLLAAQYGANK